MAEYWAGVATGLGWGLFVGLIIALWVALTTRRLDEKAERDPNFEPIDSHRADGGYMPPARYEGAGVR